MIDKEKYLEIFERYILNQATDEEINVLCTFINNNPDLNEWLENEIVQSSPFMDENIKLRMLENIRSQANYKLDQEDNKKVSSFKFDFRWVVNVAAILLPFVLLIGGYSYYKNQEIDYLSVSAGAGEKSNILLPDGSKVFLNSESEIIYSTAYNKRNRNLKLIGEAYFEVVSDQSKPFIVESGDVNVKVLGTTFNVKAYEDDPTISVVLNTGKVEFITPITTIAMQQNERVIYDKKDQTTQSDKVNASDFIGWKNNKLRFESETLENIAKVISRMHNIDIHFVDDQLSSLKFTGTIDNTSIKSALNVLELTAPIKYEVKDSVIYLYENKEKAILFN